MQINVRQKLAFGDCSKLRSTPRLMLLLVATLPLAGCGHRHAASIEAVLAADVRVFQESQTTEQIITKLRAISLKSCPAEFNKAYLARIHALERLQSVQQRSAALVAEAGSTDALAESFIRGIFGDPFGKSNEISAANKKLNEEEQQIILALKQATEQVELVATSFGAELPTTATR